MSRATARVPAEVSAGGDGGRYPDRGGLRRVAGTSAAARRTRGTLTRRAVMKRIATILTLAVCTAPGLAAQDTTKAAAPAAAAPAAAAVDVAEAVVARSVVDRQPQDTGTAFPADAGQLNCWSKVTGARSEERRVGKECRSRWSPY